MIGHLIESVKPPALGRWLTTSLILGTFLVAAPLGAVAQAQTGTITGAVTGPQGEPLAGAQVSVEGTGLGALSGADGTYTVRNVPAGTQTLRVTFIGYRTETATVTVRAGAEVSQDFRLTVDPLGLEAVVVTATRTPQQKLESSMAVTTMSSSEVEREEPRSTADLMKSVPGFYAESSGGEVNNNLFVRGLPADGSYRYVVFMEDGMMAHDANDLFFMGADNLIRVDENVDRIEAVRGGASALYGSNAPGGLVNLISKTGGPDLSGTLKASYGTGDLNRYAATFGGPIAEDWRFHVGGFYRFDDGVRDPGFPASRGGQLKFNVTRLLENGHVRLFGKYINDSNVFYLPLPLQPAQPTGGGEVEVESEFVRGFPDDGTMTTRDATFRRVPLPQNNGEFIMPLENGIASVGGSGMVELFFEFPDGWTIQNNLRLMTLDHQWNAITADGLLDAGNFVEESQNVFGRLEGVPTNANTEFTFASSGNPFNTGNGLLSGGALIHVERPVSNVSNQFQVKKELETGEITHNFTVGTYFGHYTADNLWLINNTLTEVADQPRMVNALVTDPATGDTILASENGFTDYLSGFVNGFGNASLFAFFAGDEIQLTERLRVDVGGRFERDTYEQNVEQTESFDLGDPTTTADDAVTWGTGNFDRVSIDFDEWAVSFGINYLLTEQVSVYGRASRGYKMPLLDQYLFATDPTAEGFPNTAETLYQAEGGVKVSSPYLGLSAVAYWVQLSDFPSQDLQRNPDTGEIEFITAFVGKARTIGAEVEAVAAPYPGVQLQATGTVQDPSYVDFIQGGDTLDGNWVRRIPRVFLNAGGSYTYSGVSIGADWDFFGKRFSDNANTISLPEFGVLNARASVTIPNQGVTLSAAALNVLDGAGLTEGNPRLDEAGAPAGPTLARPVLPRRFQFAVRYDF